jgi:glycosyltransferase involved in cell wall biosynthesis
VVHHSINTSGGETTLALEMIRALDELGFSVKLVTAQKPNIDQINQLYGKKISIRETRSLLPFRINYFGVYQRLLVSLFPLDLTDSDIIINTNGCPLNSPFLSKVPYIVYMHFPTLFIGSKDYGKSKYKASLFWNIYFKPYQMLANKISKQALLKSDVVLTNSRFSRDAVRKAYPNVKPYVLYPPVDVERFSSAYRCNARERKVLVIARFSPEKQIENAIKIAKLLKGNVRFEIIGSLIPANRRYFENLKKMILENKLQEVIKLIPNASNLELLESMSTSRIYLHTMIAEHFGVSVIEAMAAGLLPLVPCIGGSSEIVPSEYQYDTLEQAVSRISENIDQVHYDKREHIYNIATDYSIPKFRKELRRYIQMAIETNSGDSMNKINKEPRRGCDLSH